MSFAFQLLRGEVNYVDLMLIEAIKVFYPIHYEFIKSNPIYFTTPYRSNQFVAIKPTFEQKKEEIIQHLDNLSNNFNKKEKDNLKSLLTSLFPRLEEVFGNSFQYDGENDGYKQKRIGSPSYFNRYFSFTISEGELSDISFDALMAQSMDMSAEDLAQSFRTIIGDSSTQNFLHKMRSVEEDFDWGKSKLIAKSISLIGDIFPEKFSFFTFGYDSPDKQAAIFIYQLLKKHSKNPECFSLANELMNIAQPFEFAYEINNMLRTGKTEEEQLFNFTQYQELAKSLKNRALKEAEGLYIFEKFPSHTGYLFSTWHEYDKEGFTEYINGIINSNPEKVMPIIVAFVPLSRSSNHPLPFHSNLDKNQFLFITGLIDKEIIHNAILQVYNSELAKEEAKFDDFYVKQSEINILRQFEYWYKELSIMPEKQ